jgi:pentatricopeptide repeat domain-containing protein 1
MDKTIQKVCELLLRACIESPNVLFNEVLSVGVRALSSRPNDIFFNKLIDFAFKNKQVGMAETLFTFMTKELGIYPTIVTINTLIDQYFKNHQ